MTSKQLLELTPDQVAKLPSKAIPGLVQAAIQLDRDLDLFSCALAHAKSRLLQEARYCLESENRSQRSESALCPPSSALCPPSSFFGGTYTFNDPDGQSAQISFPQPSLIRAFWLHEQKAYRKLAGKTVELPGLLTLSGCAFEKIFSVNYKPGKAFRELLPALLPKKADQLLQLCTEPTPPRVTFKTK